MKKLLLMISIFTLNLSMQSEIADSYDTLVEGIEATAAKYNEAKDPLKETSQMVNLVSNNFSYNPWEIIKYLGSLLRLTTQEIPEAVRTVQKQTQYGNYKEAYQERLSILTEMVYECFLEYTDNSNDFIKLLMNKTIDGITINGADKYLEFNVLKKIVRGYLENKTLGNIRTTLISTENEKVRHSDYNNCKSSETILVDEDFYRFIELYFLKKTGNRERMSNSTWFKKVQLAYIKEQIYALTIENITLQKSLKNGEFARKRDLLHLYEIEKKKLLKTTGNQASIEQVNKKILALDTWLKENDPAAPEAIDSQKNKEAETLTTQAKINSNRIAIKKLKDQHQAISGISAEKEFADIERMSPMSIKGYVKAIRN